MRISKDTKAALDRVSKHYNLSASATVDKQRKEDKKNE